MLIHVRYVYDGYDCETMYKMDNWSWKYSFSRDMSALQ